MKTVDDMFRRGFVNLALIRWNPVPPWFRWDGKHLPSPKRKITWF